VPRDVSASTINRRGVSPLYEARAPARDGEIMTKAKSFRCGHCKATDDAAHLRGCPLEHREAAPEFCRHASNEIQTFTVANGLLRWCMRCGSIADPTVCEVDEWIAPHVLDFAGWKAEGA
jgi:hypothetical protein